MADAPSLDPALRALAKERGWPDDLLQRIVAARVPRVALFDWSWMGDAAWAEQRLAFHERFTAGGWTALGAGRRLVTSLRFCTDSQERGHITDRSGKRHAILPAMPRWYRCRCHRRRVQHSAVRESHASGSLLLSARQ